MIKNYTDRVTIKIFFMLLVSLIGVPAFFYYDNPIWLAVLFTFYGLVTNALSQIGYHRWICHTQFEPNFIARYLMIYSVVISGLGNPVQYVYSHLIHHKNSDKPGDPHNPKEIGWSGMLLGRYKTPDDYVSIRPVLQKKDVYFVSKHYWKFYILFTCIHAVISPWLVIWQAFNFTHAWVGMAWLNTVSHRTGGPSQTRGFTNLWMMGEGNHHIHHKNGRLLDMSGDGQTDWAGRYVIPALLAK